VGFARANNQAIRQAEGRYSLLLNSDTVLLRSALPELLTFARGQSRLGAIGPMLLNTDGTFQASYNSFPSLWGELLSAAGLSGVAYGRYYPSHSPDDSQTLAEADWIPGSCLLVSRDAIGEIGLLDERYIMYSEETDWCYRLRNAGWGVFYLPDAQVIHHGGGSAERYSGQQLRLLYRSKVLFFRKFRGSTAAAVLACGIIAATCAKILAWALWWVCATGTRRRRLSRKISAHWQLLRDPQTWVWPSLCE